MSTATEYRGTDLDARDPNLAFLASKAAIELDRLRQGRPKGFAAVGELAQRLRNSTTGVAADSEPTALWNPTTISLIHSAIRAEGSRKVSSLSDLVREALDVADQLESARNERSDISTIERLRSFCIGLANSAIALDRSEFDQYLDKARWS